MRDHEVFFRWLKHVGVFTLGLVVSVAIGNAFGWWLQGAPVDGVLYTSWALQVGGGAAIVIGLSSTESFFNVRSLFQVMKARLARLFRRKQSFNAQGVASSAIAVAAAGEGIATMGGEASTEQRLERLETLVASLQNTTKELENRLRKEARRLQTAISDEAGARKSGDAELARKLERAMVGSIHLEYLGVFWILVGITLAAFAKPLAPVLESLYPMLLVSTT